MISSFGKRAVAAATVAALGGLGVAVAHTPARASGFSTAYTCALPLLGPRAAILDGWLTSPGQAAVNGTAAFRLHIARLTLNSPVPIDSWNASASIGVRGAESSSFRVSGSGGVVPARQPLSGDLIGDWAPTRRGTDLLSVNSITISANTATTGTITAQCVPSEARQASEILTVFPPYATGGNRPHGVRYHQGWNRPHRAVWYRVAGRPRHDGPARHSRDDR
ncbi:hypothetical protein GCM10027176_70950 [Actinoallomurus bryophytorum]|uniref:Dehydratase n=1 Tax=Actinoallomurus bryophytorum TaxID=1490222 RepID=A0A543CUJ5_9ACTN|nr:hypothetical protein [Actinoallomurus bryophytorum]TQM00780.1 hypothetical protein FB559_6503 [Actinoallomurus bryophytorum]